MNKTVTTVQFNYPSHKDDTFMEKLRAFIKDATETCGLELDGYKHVSSTGHPDNPGHVSGNVPA